MKTNIICLLYFFLSQQCFSQFLLHESLLQINFDSSYQDLSNSSNVVIGNNIEYGTDRFGNENKALKLRGWCNGSPSYLQIPNSDNLAFDNNGFSISFWLKADLSTGMDPSNGACSTNGHHVLFAKGGDGYGTSPNGFYSKLNPLAFGDSEHLFGSSIGSGNLNYSKPLTNVSSWHFYAYIVGQTTFDFYMDGELIQSQSHSIDFTEANNEDLFIGIFGPKSTPVLGITNWFPLKGSLDDFYVFKGKLSLYEIRVLFLKDERTSLIKPPAISRLEFLQQDKILSGNRYQMWDKQVFEFENDINVILTKPNWGSSYDYASLFKFNKDSLIVKAPLPNEGYTYYATNDFLFFKNGQYVLIQDLLFGGLDKILYFDIDFNVTDTVRIGNFEIKEAFLRNENIILIGNEILSPENTFVKILDLSGTLLREFILNDEPREIHHNYNELILVTDNQFLRFNTSLTSYSIVSLSSLSTVLTKEKLLLRQNSNLILFDFATSSPSLLNQSVDQVFLAKDSLSYFFVRGNLIERYNSNHILQHSFEAPIDLSQSNSFVNFENDYFVFRNSPQFHEFYLLNQFGIILQTNVEYGPEAFEPFFDFAFFENGDFIYSTVRGLSKISSTGELLWKTAVATRSFFQQGFINMVYANSDNSIWVFNPNGDHVATKLNSDLNRCDFQAINPFKNEYCHPINAKLHQIEPTFEGSLPSFYPSLYWNGSTSIILKNYGFGFTWKKDGNIISHDYFGQFTGDGNYEFSIKQFGCEEVNSQSKRVVYSSDANPNINLSIDKSPICKGQTSVITGLCTTGNLNWLDGFVGTYPSYNSRTTSPINTTSYFAYCEKKYFEVEGNSSVLGTVCQSPITASEIIVIQPSDIIELTGISQSNLSYFTGSLSSSQLIPNTLNNSYSAIKSIDLKPGFHVQTGGSFIASIDDTCEN
jgi:hypothetical protein